MITLHRLAAFERILETRLPFRYGIAVMTRVPHVWVELEATIDGRSVVGRAADHFPPKWFTKDPARVLEEEIAEMREVLRQAGQRAIGLSGSGVADLVAELHRPQAVWAREAMIPPLLANFGVSLVERALIDAYCRRHDITLAEAVHANRLGVRLGDLHESLRGSEPADWLPAAPLGAIISRHTVGLGDPLESADLVGQEWPEDGLPVSLADVIRTYRQKHFKIKIAADDGGLERLERAVGVIGRETRGDFAASLDGNETFGSVDQLRRFWEQAKARPGLAPLWSRLLFVEQPFARAIALEDAIGGELAQWKGRPPLIIDESGAETGDLRRALALGYVGTSHKNCKGVIHGLANACLLAQRRRLDPAGTWIMSGEDLSNVGPVALPQDLAVQAVLGNASVERNGHHYFAGLSAWPEAVQQDTLTRFPGLYARTGRGWPTLQISDGQLDLSGVNRNAFGATTLAPLTAEQGPWLEL